MIKFNKFSRIKGNKQKLPKERDHVIVVLGSVTDGLPDGFAIGYLKYAAGCKNSPYFVVQGLHNGNEIGWIDCLPDGIGKFILEHNTK